MNDLIIGIHSIVAAIKNPLRTELTLWATKENLSELMKAGLNKDELGRVNVKLVSPHQVQEQAKRLYNDRKFHYGRVPTNLLLEATSLPQENVSWIYKQLDENKKLKILCLDQVTDAHNGAALMRTASFYGADCLLTAVKGNFGSSPTFFRIASGACEHIKIIRCGSLPKIIKKLAEMSVNCIALSEHAANNDLGNLEDQSICLILGAEDVGISNALERVVEKKVALISQGPIKSLNVSVAGAVAMEKLFGN